MKTGKIILAAVVLSVLAGCKPTESNYRNAYDAAKAKREAAEAEKMIPASGLMNDEGPSMRIVDGDTLFISRDRLRRIPNDTLAPLGVYNVAVGVYRMNTNADASAADLKKEGYAARAVQTTGNRWYTIAGSFGDLKEVSSFIREFREKNPAYPYIGLPGAPVVVGK